MDNKIVNQAGITGSVSPQLQTATDMHREAFEREFCNWPFEFYSERDSEGDYTHSHMRDRWEGYQAAIRHLTEQNEQRDSHE